MDTRPGHPIRVVARRTGLTPATIRAWERRYGAVQPRRSEGGQRLYSDRDLERLDTLRHLTELGRSISSVAALDDDEAAALLREDRSAAVGVDPPRISADAVDSWTNRAYTLLVAMDDDALERALWGAFAALGAARFLEAVVAPLLRRVGEGWQAGDVSPAQEHLASTVIDRLLAEVTERSILTEDGPHLLVATLPGERHGLGARLVCASAALRGWRVKYLGTDLPPREIARSASTLGARTVAISVVGSDLARDAALSLAELRGALPPQVELLVGGRASSLLDGDSLPDGVDVLDGLDAIPVA